jgi:hypothetical protein
VQVAELQRSVGFPALRIVEERLPPAKPKRTTTDLQVSERLQSLGVVLERLWRFYDAMHRGMPLPANKEILPEIRAALKGVTGPGGAV